MTEFENLAGTLREEAKISFKKYCNNLLFKDIYIKKEIEDRYNDLQKQIEEL